MLNSRTVIYAVRDLVSHIVAKLVARKVSDVSRELGLADFLAAKLLPALSREDKRLNLARTAGTFVALHAGPALGDEVIREIAGVLRTYVPAAADALVRWLRSADTRADLSARGRVLLPRILEKLSDLQKLFISAGQFDRRLNEKMPEIVDETIAAAEKMVRDARQQERVVGMIVESAQGWRDSLLGTPTQAPPKSNDPRQKLADSTTSVLNRLLGRLGEPQSQQFIAGLTRERLLRDHRTLGAFLSDTFSIGDSEIVEILCARILSYLVRPDTAQLIAGRLRDFLFDLVEDHAQTTIGEALRIDTAKKRALDQYLRARGPRVLEALIPKISKKVFARIRSNRLFAVAGACMGFVIGVVLSLLRLW
jgi:hypothetical protein